MFLASAYLKICFIYLFIIKEFRITKATLLQKDELIDQVRRLTNYEVVEPLEMVAAYRNGEKIVTKKILEFSAFGNHYQIELEKQNSSYYNGALVEYLGENNTYQGKLLTEIGCFYSGIVTNSHNGGDNSSKVLMNGCDGYEGIINTETRTLFIEPMLQTATATQTNLRRKHIIYRKEDVLWNKMVTDTMEPEAVETPHVSKNTAHRRTRRSGYESFLSIKNSSGRKVQLFYVDDYGKEVPFMAFLLGERRGVNTFTGTTWIAKDSITNQILHMNKAEKYVAGANSITARTQITITKPDGMIFNDNESNEVDGDEHFIEVMVVADPSVTNFHGRDKVEKYILTMMGITASTFDEKKIGTRVKFQVVRMLFIEDEKRSFRVYDRNPTRTLVSACEFISNLQHQNENHQDHFDFAVVLTRKDFGPSGYAQLYSMCSRRRSCVLVQDEGLTSAFIVAHETGHLFGIDHDGDGESVDCAADSTQGSIMAPIIRSKFDRYHWSSCSKEVIKQNILYFSCLKNKPLERKVKEGSGAMYTLDEQCQFTFDKSVKRCDSFTFDPCTTLWCADPRRSRYCKTMHGPALEGTLCGNNKHCSNGGCIEQQNAVHEITTSTTAKPPVNGNWGSWFSWSSCSQSCGVGVRSRIRICDSPRPDKDGKPCKGEAIQRDICNTHECQIGKSYSTLLDEQCEVQHGSGWTLYTDQAFTARLQQRYNNLNCTFDNGFCNWKNGNENNKLSWLLNSGSTPSYGTGPSYDNTQKNKLGKYIHIEASSTPQINKQEGDKARLISPVVRVPRLCVSLFYHMYGQEVGELEVNILYSNGSEFNLWKVKGNQGNKWEKRSVFFESVNSYQVVIQAVRGHHWSGDIAVDDITAVTGLCELKKKILTDENTCTMSCRSKEADEFKMNSIVMDGTPCRDDRSTDICIEGQCVRFGCDKKLGSTLLYDDCMLCGGNGTSCVRRNGRKELITNVDYQVLLHLAKGSTFINLTDASQDSRYFGLRKSLGSGTYLSTGAEDYYNIDGATFHFVRNSRGKQQIYAKGPLQSKVDIVVYSFSNQLDKRVLFDYEYYEPSSIEYTYKYEIKRWQDCSRTCGTGRQNSIASCVRLEDETEVDKQFCNGLEEPLFVRVCSTTPCQDDYRWLVRGWTECSASCDSGFKNRLVRCLRNSDEAFVSEQYCSLPVPQKETTCNLGMCPVIYEWNVEMWETCSHSCGGGLETRKVHCVVAGKREEVDEKHCQGITKPDVLQPCNAHECETFLWKVIQEGECTLSCGGGSKVRIVNCINEKTEIIVDNKYCDGPSPLRIASCNNEPCPEYVWAIGESSPCSKTCGDGFLTRGIKCVIKKSQSTVNDLKCPGEKPTSHLACNERDCVSYRVAYSTWSTCSSLCGIGTQKRSAYCVTSDYRKVVSAEKCQKGNYNLERSCLRAACGKPADLQCNFDSKSFCNWINIQSDDFDWSLAQNTPSVNTGPKSDHTTNVGYFAYIEASLPRRHGNKAQLTSPFINIRQGCLAFWYHMKGSSVGKLTVTLATRYRSNTIFEKEKEQSDDWLLAKVDVHGENLTEGFRFLIEATVGYGVYSDIAIDDLSLHDEPCKTLKIIIKKANIPSNCREQSPYCSHHMRETYCKESQAYRNLCCKTCPEVLAS